MNSTAPNNVVSLSEHDRFKRPEGSNPLVECRDMAADLLARSLARMLDRIDESLYELAENALNTDVQRLYLDARANARAYRSSIEADFRRNFVSGFNKKLTAVNSDSSLSFSSLAATMELSLVDEHELESSIMASDIAKKLRSKSGDELTALDCRMSQLMRNPDLAEEDNPLGPQAVINAFKEACNRLESNVNVKLIILKQFDTLVSDDIQQVYQNLNLHLIQRNVLPTIPPELLRRRGKSMSAPPQRTAAPDKPADVAKATSEQSGGASELELFQTLQQLLAARQPSAGVAAMHTAGPGTSAAHVAATGGAGGATQAAAGGFPSLNASMVDVLTSLQQGDIAAIVVDGAADLAQLDAGRVNVLHQLKDTAIGRQAEGVDAMTIDIVAMLFDYIFDDRKIPDSLKALIGRLQIPILKVAILDKKFFSRKTHPARRLLDTLAHTAIGWNEQGREQDRLYAKLDSLVHRILSSFEDDLAVFESAQQELEQFLADEEQQALQLAEASAKVIYDHEWLAVAKAVAEAEIRRRISGADVPTVIREFLSSQWSGVLLSAYVRNGSDSEAWRGGLQTMDDLIWSVQAKRAAEDRMKLVSMLPGMLKRLEAGLESCGTGKEVRERFFSELVRAHATAIKSGVAPVQAASDPLTPPVAVTVTFDSAPVAVSPIEQLLVDELVPMDRLEQAATRQTVSSFESDLIASANLRNPEKFSEIQQVMEDRLLDQMGGDPFDQQARTLLRGSWVEFTQEDGVLMRAKLAWVSPMKSMYLFTNRQGLNAMSIKLAGLAARLRAGTARLVEDDALVDRAVSSLLVSLQSPATLH